jgi:hypothetical protein
LNKRNYRLLDMTQDFTRDRGAAIAGKPAPTGTAAFAISVYTGNPCGIWLASDGAISITTESRHEKGDPKVAFF